MFFHKKAKKGAGLGLYMSKIIIEKYSNREISVESGKNGTVFVVRLGVADD